jgi:uncharacterized protein (DUF1810 family)
MTREIDLRRFIDSQRGCYERVKREMEAGHKQSCWIWFIFPQIEIKKSGVSSHHRTYAIHSLEEAKAYLDHPLLGARLNELSQIVLTHPKVPINTLMGWSLDAMKFKSSMTLFSLVSEPGSVFHQVLDQFFEGKRCPITLKKFDIPLNAQEIADNEKADAKRGKPKIRRPILRRYQSDSSEDEEEVELATELERESEDASGSGEEEAEKEIAKENDE